MQKPGRIVGLMVLAFVFVQMAAAHDQTEIHKRLAEVAQHVKQVQDPAAKRALLDNTFQQLAGVVDAASKGPLATTSDQAALKSLARNIQEKRDELNGKNGFQWVDDSKLNRFADYSIQDLEQADQWVYISTGTIILIVLLILLLRA
jgi:hypothetical protein